MRAGHYQPHVCDCHGFALAECSLVVRVAEVIHEHTRLEQIAGAHSKPIKAWSSLSGSARQVRYRTASAVIEVLDVAGVLAWDTKETP